MSGNLPDGLNRLSAVCRNLILLPTTSLLPFGSMAGLNRLSAVCRNLTTRRIGDAIMQFIIGLNRLSAVCRNLTRAVQAM